MGIAAHVAFFGFGDTVQTASVTLSTDADTLNAVPWGFRAVASPLKLSQDGVLLRRHHVYLIGLHPRETPADRIISRAVSGVPIARFAWLDTTS